jgi:hypothetical protein
MLFYPFKFNQTNTYFGLLVKFSTYKLESTINVDFVDLFIHSFKHNREQETMNIRFNFPLSNIFRVTIICFLMVKRIVFYNHVSLDPPNHSLVRY